MVKESEQKPKSQPQRFKEAARELGCEDSEEAFDEALKKVAKHKPLPPKRDEPDKK